MPARLLTFYRGRQPALDEARARDRSIRQSHQRRPRRREVVHKPDEVKLHAPWPERRIACVGGNYATASDSACGPIASAKPTSPSKKSPQKPRKPANGDFGKCPPKSPDPAAPIPFPKRVTYFDYEGEVAIVIGKRGKNIPAGKINDYVWGVTLFHDWSIRDGGGTDRAVSYNLQKNFDGAASMGPCIVVGETDHQDVDVETRVNGVVRQSYSTNEMIWNFGEVLEYLSQDFTFVPGDVIAGGTSAGTAADKSRRSPDGKRPLDLFLKVGDTVEVSSSKIGALSNKIVASELGSEDPFSLRRTRRARSSDGFRTCSPKPS